MTDTVETTAGDGTGRKRLRFLVQFVLVAGIMATIFWRWQSLFSRFYLYPIAYLAALILETIGIPVQLDAQSLPAGFCLLIFEDAIFRIIHECTGIFALLMLLAAQLAYPAGCVARLRGVLSAIPAFIAYSSIRLVVLGAVVQVNFAWLRFFHVYLMVLLNYAFVLLLFTRWVDRVRNHG